MRTMAFNVSSSVAKSVRFALFSGTCIVVCIVRLSFVIVETRLVRYNPLSTTHTYKTRMQNVHFRLYVYIYTYIHTYIHIVLEVLFGTRPCELGSFYRLTHTEKSINVLFIFFIDFVPTNMSRTIHTVTSYMYVCIL